MGFVSSNFKLEQYLKESGLLWVSLSDKSYRHLIQEWRSAFESRLISNSVSNGDKSILKLEEKLPINCYLFNCPNYRYLMRTVGGTENTPTFGYKVNGLLKVDREILNSSEAILCDENFKFMCAFNHEAPNMIPEVYCEV